MLTDREVIVNLAVQHIDGEGDWALCTADECIVGED